MKKTKKVMLIILIMLVLIVLSLIIILKLNSSIIETADEVERKQETSNSMSFSQILKDVDEDKIFNIVSEYSTMDPSLDNLYNYSDVVLIGTFNSNLKTYATEVSIHTLTKFNTLTVIKNKTDIDVKDSVTFDRIGGAMTLSEYTKTALLRKDEFTDIPTTERNSYYVVEQYAPSNKLDFDSKNSNPYILFLSYRNGELHSFIGYYGMREIQDKSVYDYDTDKYIGVKDTKILNAFNKIK